MTPHEVGPSQFGDEAGAADAEFEEGPSLAEDLKTLASDGKTYLQAELAFQKSRARFTAGRAKSSVVYGAAALALLHLALIALVVGMVFALATLVGPWWATAIVVLVLLLGAGLFVIKLRREVTEIGAVFGGEAE